MLRSRNLLQLAAVLIAAQLPLLMLLGASTAASGAMCPAAGAPPLR
jgi:hypothetical protein